MRIGKRKNDQMGDQEIIVAYSAAFRTALRARRELSILARSSGMGGDRERLLSDLALARTAMDALHDEAVRVLRTRVAVPL